MSDKDFYQLFYTTNTLRNNFQIFVAIVILNNY